MGNAFVLEFAGVLFCELPYIVHVLMWMIDLMSIFIIALRSLAKNNCWKGNSIQYCSVLLQKFQINSLNWLKLMDVRQMKKINTHWQIQIF